MHGKITKGSSVRRKRNTYKTVIENPEGENLFKI
jgi:hypothetical protein